MTGSNSGDCSSKLKNTVEVGLLAILHSQRDRLLRSCSPILSFIICEIALMHIGHFVLVTWTGLTNSNSIFSRNVDKQCESRVTPNQMPNALYTV